MNLKQLLKQLLKNKDFEKEFCIPNAIEIMIIRKLKGLTQKELAEKCDMQQPAISRLENQSESVTLKSVGKVAHALGYRAELKFTKLSNYKK